MAGVLYLTPGYAGYAGHGGCASHHQDYMQPTGYQPDTRSPSAGNRLDNLDTTECWGLGPRSEPPREILSAARWGTPCKLRCAAEEKSQPGTDAKDRGR